MNKLILLLISVATIGGGIFLFSNNTYRSTKPLADLTQETKEVQDNGNNQIIKKGSPRYIEYSKNAYDETADKRRVLYFYASWCPTCKAANADFMENPNKIPEDAVVIRVNYNDPNTDQEEKNLAKTYGVTYQHTFVQIDHTGKEVAIWNGGDTNELNKSIK